MVSVVSVRDRRDRLGELKAVGPRGRIRDAARGQIDVCCGVALVIAGVLLCAWFGARLCAHTGIRAAPALVSL